MERSHPARCAELPAAAAPLKSAGAPDRCAGRSVPTHEFLRGHCETLPAPPREGGMKSIGTKPQGLRLERIQSSPLWAGARFRNIIRCSRACATRAQGRRRFRSFCAAGAPVSGPSIAFGRSARWLDKAARKRIAGDLARAFDGSDRNRWLPRAHRPGVGSARVSLAPHWSEAVPACSDCATFAAADRCRHRLARPLRPSRLRDDQEAREARRAVRHLARRRRTPRSLGCANRSALRSSIGGSPMRCRMRT